MLKLIIFDHDMTIVNSIDSIRAVFIEVADLLGLPHVTHEQVLSVIAEPLPDMFRIMLGECRPEWVQMYVERSPVMEQKYLKPFSDLEPAIKSLRGMGLYTAVASNRENPTDVMTHAGIAHLFDAIIGAVADDGHRRPYKPAPDMLIELLEKFHVTRDQAAYVGDATIDMEAAKRAGIRGIGIPRGCNTTEELLAHGAWRVINSLEDLSKLATLPYSDSGDNLKENGQADQEAMV